MLIAAGVAPADIDRAIDDSRKVVRRAGAAARLLSRGAKQVGQKSPEGSKRQRVALVGSMWLDRIAEETGGMLRPRGKR